MATLTGIGAMLPLPGLASKLHGNALTAKAVRTKCQRVRDINRYTNTYNNLSRAGLSSHGSFNRSTINSDDHE